MRRLLVILLVLGICLVGATQLAFATDTAGSPRGMATGRFLDKLPEETREQVKSIMEEYQGKMTALRNEMREAIAPYIPEEWKEQLANRKDRAPFFFEKRMMLGRCLEELPEETREQVKSIIAEYQNKLAPLYEEMKACWESGDEEGLKEVRSQILALRQEMQEKIAPYIPEEWKEQYNNREPGMCNTYRFKGRGWKGAF